MTTAQTQAVDGATILSLIGEAGNRQVLETWLQSQGTYQLLHATSEIESGSFDCCLFDRNMLFDHQEQLLARKERESVVLPYLLLVPEGNHREIRNHLQRDHPDLWGAIDGLIDMPVSEDRLSEKLETFLRLREQSVRAHEQREQLRQIRDQHTGHGVLITDTDGTIEYVNQAFEEQSGYTKEEAVGENPRILKSGEHEGSFYADMWDTILAGEIWHGTVFNERKNGEQYVVDQTIAPVDGPDGDIEKFVAVNHEITELKELEHRLRHQREQLDVLNRVLRHDIRNDMDVVLTWTELLEDEVPPSGQDQLEKIIRASRHVVELTTVSRNLSEIIQEDAEPELEPVLLHRVLCDELDKRRETHDDATIQMPDPPDPDLRVLANQLLSSVFRNLVNNAVQHNDSEHPVVSLAVEAAEATVQIRIADNGPGIPDDLKESLFSEGEKGLESEGTGIGLYLVQSLVESFRGDVWIEDRTEPLADAPDDDGTGAEFVVELQIAEDKADEGGWQ